MFVPPASIKFIRFSVLVRNRPLAQALPINDFVAGRIGGVSGCVKRMVFAICRLAYLNIISNVRYDDYFSLFGIRIWSEMAGSGAIGSIHR